MAAARGDKAAALVIEEIDRVNDEERAADTALNKEMAERLGQGGKVSVSQLINVLEANPDLERWLLRRVHLTRAHGRPLADDEHHENE